MIFHARPHFSHFLRHSSLIRCMQPRGTPSCCKYSGHIVHSAQGIGDSAVLTDIVEHRHGLIQEFAYVLSLAAGL